MILSVTVFFKGMGSFVLRSVHQNASFELSNTAYGQFFKIFTIRDLGGVKVSGKERQGQKFKRKTVLESA